MQDATLIRISLVMVLLGLPAVALAARAIPAPSGDALLTDSLARFNATVLESRNKGELTRATVETCIRLKAVAFDPVPLEVGQRVAITARRDEYQGEEQWLVERIDS